MFDGGTGTIYFHFAKYIINKVICTISIGCKTSRKKRRSNTCKITIYV
jgi:hypothetical protein